MYCSNLHLCFLSVHSLTWFLQTRQTMKIIVINYPAHLNRNTFVTYLTYYHFSHSIPVKTMPWKHNLFKIFSLFSHSSFFSKYNQCFRLHLTDFMLKRNQAYDSCVKGTLTFRILPHKIKCVES